MAVSLVSLKFKYVAAAVITAVCGALLLGAFALYQSRVEGRTLREVATTEVRDAVSDEIGERAKTIAALVADSAASSVRSRSRATLASRMQPFLVDDDVTELVISDSENRELFAERRAPKFDGARITRVASAPIRVVAETSPGASSPQTLGIARIAIMVPDTAAAVSERLSRAQGAQLLRGLFLAGAIGFAALALASSVAWWAARRLKQPIDALIRSADRISQGDYSRPLDVARRDEIGELQKALERMRHKLRQTTITKNYLNSVLASMTDAVFVTSPDGVIRVINLAARRLLGYSEEELIGRGITSILDERERANFDVLQAANETREAVVRTRQGQTIPVSLTGSVIATDDPQFQGSIFVARNITDRKRAERRIRYLARYDTLTKVPNRMQFQHLLQQSIARAYRSDQAVALMYLDADRFKEVNDTFGHEAGDRALEVLTERLTRVLPSNTVVGRLAGDEFALFIDALPGNVDNRGPIGHLARSILSEVAKAFQLNGQEIFLTASIGIAFCPRDAENVIDLIRNADAAMYYSKQNGGNTFAFYAPEMNAAAVERLMLKSKLRRAVERDELVIKYQPKVNLHDGRIVGAEALLRWRLPGHGDIPPGQFIPLAEETNLILDIGEWVMNRVCLDYVAMRGEVEEPGRISLNLSLRQLRQASFIVRCRSVFKRHNVMPSSFELEITESTLMQDAKRTIHLLRELHDMGLHLSIDDFGTGYSSLSALQQFPIGTLKIDQSFVRRVDKDAGDATIVRTIIDMGRSLGMDVIAEGIEQVGHLEFLRDNRCHYGQGNLFGEACSLEELTALLARQQAGFPPFANVLPAETGRLNLQA